MSWLDFSHKSVSAPEQKQAQTMSFAEFLNVAGSNGDLSAAAAIGLFVECKPFFDAVKRRSTAFSSIQPRVWDVEENEFVDDHPVLTKLKHPNPWESYESWAKQLAEFFDVTGNSFPLATGPTNNPPLELYVERPQTINLAFGNQATFYNPQTITVNRTNASQTFDLNFKKAEGITTARYLSGNQQEIWQIKESTLLRDNNALWGTSSAQPVFLEIQQFIEANVNNYSILRRGGRPSLGWKWLGDSPMTDEQFVRAREELKKYAGAANAGRQAIVDKLEPQDIASTNRDMQFSEMRSTVEEDIYNIFGIPLAMISTSAMTLDNLTVSEFLFWRQSVLPLTQVLYGELTRFLLPRYGDVGTHKLQNMKLSFNPFDIQVLKEAKVREVAQLQKIYIMSDNELRTEIGREAVGPEGDIIYKPSILLPAATDELTTDNLRRPVKSDALVEQLRMMKKSDGEPMYTDAELELYIEETWA